VGKGRLMHDESPMWVGTDYDPYGLERFVAAQNKRGTYERALEELRAGYKASHWMWFVFPQVAGLGYSEMSRMYALRSLVEARAYLRHPVLGPRLLECTGLVRRADAAFAEDIFGDIDAMKLHSSMTLFMRAAPDVRIFQQVVVQYFGAPDLETDERLRGAFRA
jgi:uncharacterized protein (DUF1810 family)